MALRHIVLSVKRELWRPLDEDAMPADQEFQRVRKERLEKDDYTCQFCGWRGSSHQDVHHVNDSHQDNTPENLVTACKLCHACHHIGFASTNRGGVMILMPEITQATLNQLVRTLFIVAQVGTKDQKRQAADIWGRLAKRADAVEAAWGTSNPGRFANKLLILPQEIYDRRGDGFMAPLRMLFTPSSPMVGPAISTWAGQYKKLPSAMWSEVCETVMDRLAEAREKAMERLALESTMMAEQAEMMEQAS